MSAGATVRRQQEVGGLRLEGDLCTKADPPSKQFTR